MATIIVDIPGVTGPSTITGYTGKLPAEAIRESIYAPKSTSTTSTSSTIDTAVHSDINIVRYRDSASPKLATAASAGTLYATTTITLFRTYGSGTSSSVKKYMEYSLKNVYISRYESGTLDAEGLEFEPYINPSDPVPPPSWGISAFLGTTPVPAGVRQAPRPVRGGARGLPAETNRELERLWLNPEEVTWTYTKYNAAGTSTGTVSATWNIVTTHSA